VDVAGPVHDRCSSTGEELDHLVVAWPTAVKGRQRSMTGSLGVLQAFELVVELDAADDVGRPNSILGEVLIDLGVDKERVAITARR